MKPKDAHAPITKKQISYIWYSAKIIGLDDALLHDVVYAVTKKKSISKLTCGEAAGVIDTLARQAFPNAPKKKVSNVIYIITQEQREKILALILPMGRDESRADGLAAKMYRKPLRRLTMRQAQGLIEALKSILSRADKEPLKEEQ